MTLRLSSAALVAVLCAALIVPAASSFAATQTSPTGIVIGTVTCGPAEETPAPQARIAIEGIDLATSADSSGKFTLVNVPTGQFLTIDASTDPSGAEVTSRYNVSVQAGSITDIGNLDLTVCPAAQSQPTDAPTFTPVNGPDDGTSGFYS